MLAYSPRFTGLISFLEADRDVKSELVGWFTRDAHLVIIK